MLCVQSEFSSLSFDKPRKKSFVRNLSTWKRIEIPSPLPRRTIRGMERSGLLGKLEKVFLSLCFALCILHSCSFDSAWCFSIQKCFWSFLLPKTRCNFLQNCLFVLDRVFLFSLLSYSYPISLVFASISHFQKNENEKGIELSNIVFFLLPVSSSLLFFVSLVLLFSETFRV